MAKDWIHRKNADFNPQARNFAQRIVADAAGYGIDPAEAAQLAAEQADFAAKFQAASEPGSRTSVAVNVRDDARKVLSDHMRSIGARIRANPSITNDRKIELSLTVPGRAEHAPDGAPRTRPSVWVDALVGNRLRVRVVDHGDLLSSGKPRHYLGAQLFIATCDDDREPEDSSQWRLASFTTKSKATIKLPFLAPGTRVWIAARWLNTHGVGAFSDARRTYVGGMTVVAGSLKAA